LDEDLPLGVVKLINDELRTSSVGAEKFGDGPHSKSELSAAPDQPSTQSVSTYPRDSLTVEAETGTGGL